MAALALLAILVRADIGRTARAHVGDGLDRVFVSYAFHEYRGTFVE
jgi:hypothetical protein